MDGPFFSFMPFPDRNLNTLTHVRYTPHTNVQETCDQAPPNPYTLFDGLNVASNVSYMLHDVARFMPDIAAANYKDSLFEIKTVLQKNEGDDGRPILFEVDPASPRVLSILGSKLDNIYDAHAAIDAHLAAHKLEQTPTNKNTSTSPTSQTPHHANSPEEVVHGNL
jgi:hypothetical protein